MPSEEGRQVLRLLAEKKIDAEQAYKLLVALGDLPGEGQAGANGEAETRRPGQGRGQARLLRIRVTEGGRQKVNMTVPLSLARLGRVAGLSRVVGQFGIDLRDVAREVLSVGKIVDVVDEDGDRVEIFVE